jgi:hypothetical protein
MSETIFVFFCRKKWLKGFFIGYPKLFLKLRSGGPPDPFHKAGCFEEISSEIEISADKVLSQMKERVKRAAKHIEEGKDFVLGAKVPHCLLAALNPEDAVRIPKIVIPDEALELVEL